MTIFEIERTYKDTENIYSIMAAASRGVEDGAIKVRYHIEVTDGVFGDTPQVCGNVSQL